MKKLTSLFLGCMMITCAFTSCGDKDESDSEKSSGKKDSIVGTWDGDIDGDAGRYIFSDNGKLTMSMDWSEYLHMDGDKCYVGDEDVTEYLDFDGSDFTIEAEGTELIYMKKTKKTDEDDFDGEYDVKDGYLADLLESTFGDEDAFSISITFDGDVTYFNVKDVADYEIDGDKIILSNMPESMSDDGETTHELDFKLSGDSLTLTDPDDEDKVLEFVRAK